IIGTAGTGVFGTIESGVLENSNADLAKQLVDTIVSQRAYQANSTSISTQDELLQTIINL
ncbi:flagellar basal body rod C-terminal domain-containing protein, partial [Vreelandella venusta]